MSKLQDFLNRPGRGIDKNAPKKEGVFLFFEILWREFWDLIKLNMLFLLFCVPIVTIPAAITAMTRITLTMVQDKNYFLWQDFVKAFRRDFFSSLAAGVLITLGFSASVFGTYFYLVTIQSDGLRLILMALGIVAFVVVFIMSFYVFPQLALLELSLRQIFKNAFLLMFVCIKHNVVALILAGLLLFLGIGMLPYSMPGLVMLILSLSSLIIVFQTYPGIKQYLIKEEEPPEEPQDEPPTDWREERSRIHTD